MVSPSSITTLARPLAKQAVDKGRVWLFLIGGAAVLFLGTVLVEGNSGFFPAIARANNATRAGKKVWMMWHGPHPGCLPACPPPNHSRWP